MASSLGEMETQPIAGMIILLAGRVRTGTPSAGSAVLRNKAIYLGAGENDPNMTSARMAAEFYRSNGAAVTLEEFPGLGHEMPPQARLLKAWLEAQGPLSGKPAEDPAVAEARKDVQNLLDEAKAVEDPAQKYQTMRILMDDPRLLPCGANVAAGVQAQFKEAVQKSPAKEEWAAETAFRGLIRDEMNIHSLSDMKNVRDGYQKLAQGQAQTRFGKMAQAQHDRLAAAYEKSMQATQQANPTGPAQATGGKTTSGGAVSPAFPTTGPGDRHGALIPTRTKDGKIIYKRVDK